MVLAISSCLEVILQIHDIPKKLTSTMNAKMKTASILAKHISNLGYYGDMGYSTILYCSVLEMRKILIFLIEKLPRDSLKFAETIETNCILSLLSEINSNLQVHLTNMWIPSNLLYHGMRKFRNVYYTKHSFGSSIPLISKSFTDINIDNTGKGKFTFFIYKNKIQRFKIYEVD